MKRAWLLAVFAISLALVIWQTGAHRNGGSETAAASADAAQPGYVALGAELFDTGADGQPQYRVRASRIEQARAAGDIVLSAPEFHYQGPTEWTMTAQRGVLPASAGRIDLAGDVLARGTRAGAEDMRVRTATLGVDLQQQHLDTDDPVAIDWGRNHLSGNGLHADMKADSLRLESRVHGEFAR